MSQFPFLAGVVFNRLGYAATARARVLSQGAPIPIRDIEAMFDVLPGLVQDPRSLRALAVNARASSLGYGFKSYRERFLKAADGVSITREASRQSVTVFA